MYVKHCKLTRYQQLELMKYFVAGHRPEQQLFWSIFIAILPSVSSINYAARLPPNNKIVRHNCVEKLRSMRVISVAIAKANEGAVPRAKSSSLAC